MPKLSTHNVITFWVEPAYKGLHGSSAPPLCDHVLNQSCGSRTVSIATNVDVLATCGKLEIFSPSTAR